MNGADPAPAPPAGSRGRLLDLDEALEAILADVAPLAQTETVDIGEALKRVLAEPLVSAIDVPGFDNSAMDGYAVRSAELRAQPQRLLAVTQYIRAGDRARPLEPGCAARIFTGAPLPAGADAVIMQEQCDCLGDSVRARLPVEPGEHVRRRAHDFGRGQTVLAAGHRLRPQDLAIAAATGATRLTVRRRPRLALFSTGNELALPGEMLTADRRYTANNHLLGALARALGCEATDGGIVGDDLAQTCDALVRLAGGHDLVLSSGGASVGDADHVHRALAEVGEVRFWRIALRPGKPVLFGRAGGTAFLGLPGNPVSCFVTFLLLVRPLLLALQGATDLVPPRIAVRAAFHWPRPGSRREFVRARTILEDGVTSAHLYPDQSSDVLSSAVWADGLVEIPPGAVLAPGDRVSYLPFCGLID